MLSAELRNISVTIFINFAKKEREHGSFNNISTKQRTIGRY